MRLILLFIQPQYSVHKECNNTCLKNKTKTPSQKNCTQKILLVENEKKIIQNLLLYNKHTHGGTRGCSFQINGNFLKMKFIICVTCCVSYYKT